MAEDRKVAILIKGCRKQKQSSQLKLFKHFYSYAMGVCLPYAHNRDNALEIVNDGFLKAFTKIAQYDTNLPFKPWLRRILVNAAIDHHRKYGIKPDDLSVTSSHSDSTYNEALDSLEFDDLMQIMEKLPPTYKVVFNLYVVEGLSHAEIAEQLGISIGSSKSNLSKARQKIKNLLEVNQGIYIK